MALKRKLEVDVEDVVPLKQKQMKLVPFPNFGSDEDVAMDVEPFLPEQHHLRVPSDASGTSSASVSPLSYSPNYPTYDLHPSPFFNPETGSVDSNSHSFSHYSAQPSPPQGSLGLMQPSANNFVHHG
ncbi:hypothetical protein CC1G_07375 [Coprinopsis cinerea okayama7|uniref:Uncharacterized protein n=1 Tax=Coprinopsis cinerea (strain Okayama-7 / 130 / ATCC MYA-4618 / FGSC 9003) TaxID=240176 RepID=A8N6K4_COPC7|nr:hypothetical protein CC1G_07375 [Coprinopsis cinerea okayama7\|eukprot:XP_001830460.2 hypothetical protein CC1G_07375 [Coprinopsis cinerea okayama7\